MFAAIWLQIRELEEAGTPLPDNLAAWKINHSRMTSVGKTKQHKLASASPAVLYLHTQCVERAIIKAGGTSRFWTRSLDLQLIKAVVQHTNTEGDKPRVSWVNVAEALPISVTLLVARHRWGGLCR